MQLFRTTIMVLKPVGEFGEHLVVILESGTEAEAVATRGIGIVGTGNAGTAQRRVIRQTIGQWGNGTVVVSQDDNGGRCLARTHGIEVGELKDQLRIAFLLA